ncbi:MAG TPA: hypothetical protein VHI52_14355, partial [Verrucomicrobiae bacterium]|nr:hypothetical protein [Verrucomicrobiae bacterium]
MKIQCSCGAKFEFEVTREMAGAPVSFTCHACGRDSSAFVDSLVRKHLGQTATPGGIPIPIGTAPQLQIAKPVLRTAPQTIPPAAPNSGGEEQVMCAKHPGQVVQEKCRICGKPICPKCMELFGYVCSPLCKAKAESHGIHVPLFEGQKSVREARLWRKVGWVGAGLGTIAALV